MNHVPDFPTPDWPSTMTLNGFGLGQSTSFAREFLGDTLLFIDITVAMIYLYFLRWIENIFIKLRHKSENTIVSCKNRMKYLNSYQGKITIVLVVPCSNNYIHLNFNYDSKNWLCMRILWICNLLFANIFLLTTIEENNFRHLVSYYWIRSFLKRLKYAA